MTRQMRLLLVVTADRDERCVARWYRGEPLGRHTKAAIDQAAKQLGIAPLAPAADLEGAK